MVERHDAQKLRRMSWCRGKEIVQSPHSIRELGTRDDPAAPEARQPVDLRQAVRRDEVGSQVIRRSGRGLSRIQIHLVDENGGAIFRGDLADFFECIVVGAD